MAQRALIRGSIAVAATFAMASGFACAIAPSALADSPTETVIPAAPRYQPPRDKVAFAGPGGFLHRHEGQSEWVWTKYSGGPDIPVPGFHGGWFATGAGSDVVATAAKGVVQLQDMDAGTTTTIVPPSGQYYIGTLGTNVLTYTRAADGTIASFHILTLVDGQQTDTLVTGWPAGVTLSAVPLAGNANSAVLEYTDSTGRRLALLDMATGHVTPVFGAMTRTPYVVLTDKYVGWYLPDMDGILHVLNRSDLSAPETTLRVPLNGTTHTAVRYFAIVGDSAVFTYDWVLGYSAADDQFGEPLAAMPLSGGAVTPILDHGDHDTLSPYPGGAIVVGGTSLNDWAARRVTIDASGTPTVTAVDSDPPMPSPISGVSLAGGRLVTLEFDNVTGANTFARTVQLGNPPSYGARTAFPALSVSDCMNTSTACPQIGTGDGRIVQSANGYGAAVEGPTGSTGMNTGVSGGTLVDSDGRFVVYDNASTGKQYIGDTTLKTSTNVLFTRPITGAALSGETLWTANSTAGSISSTDLATQQTTGTVPIAAPCVPSELQAAAGRWIYWSCGASGPAGVHDLATGTDVPVPSGPSELGDGFVVEHDMTAGKLVLTDVHTGTAVTSDLAALPPLKWLTTDDRQVTWAVDKFAGGVAYVDAQENVHLVDPHIPTSPAAGYRLLPGQRLNPGDSLTSGSMRLVMQSDGNLVARLKAGGSAAPVEWASGTSGYPGAYAIMQSDGNLAIYGQNGGPGTGGMLWSSGTAGNPGAHATLQDDGNLVMYRQGTSGSGNSLWATGSYAPPRTITSGQVIKPGWWTQGKRTFLVMQRDGNLVMYRKRDGKVIWSSGTHGHPGAYADMQSDGNLVIYRPGGGPSTGGALWSTGTRGHSGAYAIMQDDGNLAIYKRGGGPSTGGALWASNTWRTAS
ncbi:hypothetical protein ACFOSC_17465 [Streptantibioticus rubrisoli]|uniref:Bulb-type lectin domain-containing protein n=1 Tax=Streptantibioticus rubrisoli TaxID=1387313 RepID=A0ABT1PHM0_9ACTN|nr:hypothetical protein [Streptantibioticus rubrisoli]MCQ4044856.1 hypothetical protein [Streptantibioticus rubrisoli]